jgi:predicted house-cleaning noncanonical NTP pyrophosphatase (MazG superfamily)
LGKEVTVGTSGKLIRDRIPEIIRADGKEPEVYQADPQEYRERLRAKLQEEVDEVLAATGDSAVVEELADVLEVVLAIADDLGVDEKSLRDIAERKAEARGAFKQRLVLMGSRYS